jgi:hypothetical protein
MKRLGAALLCLVVVGLARPAAAQTPKAEVSVGYNWLAAKQTGDDEYEKFKKGWYADVAGNVTDTVSIVGQVTGNYKTFEDDSKINIYTFMGGVRAGSAGRVRGFGQALVGGVNLKANDPLFGDFKETDFAVQFGGGVNVLGSSNVGVRLGVDYLRIMAKETGEVLFEDVNGFRFNVGVTFGIGSR